MFIVQPVRDLALSDAILSSLHCEEKEGSFKYFAAEMKEDLETVDYFIALCQFSFTPDLARITALDIREGSEGDEAVVVLVRAVMSWVYKADIKRIEFDDDRISESVKKQMSFRIDDDAKCYIDLEKFYKSPCGYGKI